ncbi:MAG: sirohydrochlorin cobaltochelatase [Coprococcus sp.]
MTAKQRFVSWGHSGDAAANAIYSDFQQRLHRATYRNYYIGTVEADPTLEQLLALVRNRRQLQKSPASAADGRCRRSCPS